MNHSLNHNHRNSNSIWVKKEDIVRQNNEHIKYNKIKERIILLRENYIVVKYNDDEIYLSGAFIMNPKSNKEYLVNKICLEIYSNEIHEMHKLKELGYFESYWCRPEYIRYKRQEINKIQTQKSSLILAEQGYEIYKIILLHIHDDIIKNKSILLCKSIKNYI